MAVDPGVILTILKLTLFISLLLVASVSDIHNRTIPYVVCILIVLTGLIGFSPVRLWGLLLAVPFFIASGFKKGGAGDIYLVAAASFVVGLASGAVGLVIGLTVFCLFYLAVVIIRKVRGQKEKPDSYPLAPFLSIGFIVVIIINGGIQI